MVILLCICCCLGVGIGAARRKGSYTPTTTTTTDDTSTTGTYNDYYFAANAPFPPKHPDVNVPYPSVRYHHDQENPAVYLPQQPRGYPPQRFDVYPPEGYPPEERAGYPPKGYPLHHPAR